MKLADANVLIYSVDATSPFHRDSRRFLDRCLSGASPVGFAWLALVAFVRLTTSSALNANPLTTTEAVDVVDKWLAAPSAQVLNPGPTHAARLRDLLDAVGAGGNLTNDAHLAALALEHRATIVTYDSDFGRFPGVKWERPI